MSSPPPSPSPSGLNLTLVTARNLTLHLPDFNTLFPPSPSFPLSPLPSSPVALAPHPLPLEALRHFIGEPFRMDVAPSWLSQMEAAIGIMLLLWVLGGAVIWRRCAEGTFWVVRRQERGDGVLLIPNAVTSFLCLENVFASVWTAYAIDQLLVMRGHVSPDRLPLWLGLTWLPLIQGAWFAGWGTFFASPLQPGQVHLHVQGEGGGGVAKGREKGSPKDPEEGRGRAYAAWRAAANGLRRCGAPHGFGLRAPVLNLIMACVPIAQMAVIITLTCFASATWMPAVHAWSSLDSSLLLASHSARAQPDPYAAGLVTPSMAQEALHLWELSLECTARFSWMWWGWHASALSFTLFYSVAGSALLLQLHREVVFLRGVIETRERRAQSTFVPDQHEEDMLAAPEARGPASLLARAAAAAAAAASATPGSRSGSRPGTGGAEQEQSQPYVFAATPAAKVAVTPPRRALLLRTRKKKIHGVRKVGSYQDMDLHKGAARDGEEEEEELVDDEVDYDDGALEHGGVSGTPRHQVRALHRSFWPPLRASGSGGGGSSEPGDDAPAAAHRWLEPGSTLTRSGPRRTMRPRVLGLRLPSLRSPTSGPGPGPAPRSGLRRGSVAPALWTRYETMRKVVFLIGVQVVCISLAAAALSGLTLYLALEMPVAGRHRSFTGLYQGANLVAAWTACVFGGAIFVAITARTFEFLTDVVALSSRLGGGGSGQAHGHGPAPGGHRRLGAGVGAGEGGSSKSDSGAGAGAAPRYEGGATLGRPHGLGISVAGLILPVNPSPLRHLAVPASAAPVTPVVNVLPADGHAPAARSGREHLPDTGAGAGPARTLRVSAAAAAAAAAERSVWRDDSVVLEESRPGEVEAEFEPGLAAAEEEESLENDSVDDDAGPRAGTAARREAQQAPLQGQGHASLWAPSNWYSDAALSLNRRFEPERERERERDPGVPPPDLFVSAYQRAQRRLSSSDDAAWHGPGASTKPTVDTSLEKARSLQSSASPTSPSGSTTAGSPRSAPASAPQWPVHFAGPTQHPPLPTTHSSALHPAAHQPSFRARLKKASEEALRKTLASGPPRGEASHELSAFRNDELTQFEDEGEGEGESGVDVDEQLRQREQQQQDVHLPLYGRGQVETQHLSTAQYQHQHGTYLNGTGTSTGANGRERARTLSANRQREREKERAEAEARASLHPQPQPQTQTHTHQQWQGTAYEYNSEGPAEKALGRSDSAHSRSKRRGRTSSATSTSASKGSTPGVAASPKHGSGSGSRRKGKSKGRVSGETYAYAGTDHGVDL